MHRHDLNKSAGTIFCHRAHPDASIDNHVKSRTLELGASIRRVAKVYLDKRFWIMLRDVHMGRSKQLSTVQLLNALRIAVDSGKVLCPISESVFLELLKQQDLNTRRTTAELIDELSHGVTLVPYGQRVAQELVGIFTKFANGSAEYHEVQELVWSKLGYVLGVVHPASTTFEPDDELAVQKEFFDHIWQFSLVEILRFLEEIETRYNDSFESTTDLLNELNRHHQSEVRNFKQVYINEFQGVLNLFMHVPRLWLEDAYEKETGAPHISTEQAKLEQENKLNTFFGNLITIKRAAIMLPSLHVPSLCHAAVRWDKKRKLSRNDFYDFHHAAAAIGYCDAFLTEKPLMTLLKQKHLELEADFPCVVIANVDDAITWVKERVGG